jgi:gluconate 2-dehydrogenase gamma chain
MDQIDALKTLLLSDLVTQPTRAALLPRLEVDKNEPSFFTPDEFTILETVSARLIPQGFANLAGDIDARLAAGESDGWRYSVMPPDGEAYKLGLRGLEDSAQFQSGLSFKDLEAHQQDTLLESVQCGTIEGAIWQTLPPKRFFEDLLAELTELYFSHPLAQQEIGYIGFADAHGWQGVGLNQPNEVAIRDLDKVGAQHASQPHDTINTLEAKRD